MPDGLYEALEDHMKSFSTANQSDAAASSRSRLCDVYVLLDYYTDLHKKSFIVRSLYEYIK